MPASHDGEAMPGTTAPAHSIGLRVTANEMTRMTAGGFGYTSRGRWIMDQKTTHVSSPPTS